MHFNLFLVRQMNLAITFLSLSQFQISLTFRFRNVQIIQWEK